MIEKHYGKYLGGDSEEQLSRLFGAKSATLGETVEAEGRAKTESSSWKIQRKGNGGPTWTRTRDQPVMSRWL